LRAIVLFEAGSGPLDVWPPEVWMPIRSLPIRTLSATTLLSTPLMSAMPLAEWRTSKPRTWTPDAPFVPMNRNELRMTTSIVCLDGSVVPLPEAYSQPELHQ
jgi:hypothetical protein